ncbi:MAG: hypothetical protein HKN26_06700 [Acidimicrobiales bacterium]|nr:hypothetical protein [Acidimicrobiales bacterium]
MYLSNRIMHSAPEHMGRAVELVVSLVDKLETETMFIDKMHAGNDLFQPGSVNRRLWRRLN